MARKRVVNQGKTAFVEEQLGEDSAANQTTINEAWRAAGHEGDISGSLVYKVRTGMGLTGGGRGRKRKQGGTAAAGKVTAGSSPKYGRKSTSNGASSHTDNGSRQSTEPAKPSRSQARDGRGRALDEVEAGIDELIFRLMEQGGMDEVQEALRRARRLLARSHKV
jgi:hypothetical protein